MLKDTALLQVQLGVTNQHDYSLQQIGTPVDQPQIYNEQEVANLISNPVTGQQFVDIQMGDVVEVRLATYLPTGFLESVLAPKISTCIRYSRAYNCHL